MSALTREEVAEIAELARLELSAGEIEALRGELGAILDHMAALQAADTDGVEPMTHAVPMDLRLRADEARPSLPVEVATAGAPATDDGCFVVPDILESSK